MNTRVVHVNNEQHTVYIGRPVWRRGLRGSRWANPFRVGRDGTREVVIAKYRRWLLAQPDLIVDIAQLRGEVLGCWCKPLDCHGDVLAELAESTR